MKKRYFLVLWIILILATSCAINPVTGKQELMFISEQGEIELGKETDSAVRSQYGLYDDPVLTEYVKQIGTALVPYTHRPHLTYHFAVLDSPVINAFAAPGGYIYVTRGLLSMMNSEAELAVVLGHELGHVNARHSVKKLSQLMLVQIGFAVGSVISETFADISGVASVGMQLLFLKFSRDDERQADNLGIYYTRSGGYDPGKMVNFFNALQKMGDLSGKHSLPGFLSTHPLTGERIKNTQALILSTDSQLKVSPSVYLNSINNIVYGEDPRQGYVENDRFYHPILRFSFSIPPEWKVQNTPAQVTLISKDGNAGVILRAEKSSDKLSQYAQKQTADSQGWRLINEQSLYINGLTSFQQLFEITQEDTDNLKARISYIRKGSYIYNFISLSSAPNFQKYDYQFGTLIGSFNELRNPKYLNRKPSRIKLFRANGRQTLRNIFQRAGMKEDLWEKFAIQNEMELGAVPPQNVLIKVVQ